MENFWEFDYALIWAHVRFWWSTFNFHFRFFAEAELKSELQLKRSFPMFVGPTLRCEVSLYETLSVWIAVQNRM